MNIYFWNNDGESGVNIEFERDGHTEVMCAIDELDYGSWFRVKNQPETRVDQFNLFNAFIGLGPVYRKDH